MPELTPASDLPTALDLLTLALPPACLPGVKANLESLAAHLRNLEGAPPA